LIDEVELKASMPRLKVQVTCNNIPLSLVAFCI